MGEFHPINTQEEFDDAIKERIFRERQKYSDYDEIKGKLADYETQISDLNGALQNANEKIAGHDAIIAEKDKIIGNLENSSIKTRIAHEYGLSYDAIGFLHGANEEEIKQSADALKSLVNKNNVPPMASGDPAPGGKVNDSENAMRQMLSNLNLGGQ